MNWWWLSEWNQWNLREFLDSFDGITGLFDHADDNEDEEAENEDFAAISAQHRDAEVHTDLHSSSLEILITADSAFSTEIFLMGSTPNLSEATDDEQTTDIPMVNSLLPLPEETGLLCWKEFNEHHFSQTDSRIGLVYDTFERIPQRH